MEHGVSWFSFLPFYHSAEAAMQGFQAHGVLGQPVVVQHVFAALLVSLVVLFLAVGARRDLNRAADQTGSCGGGQDRSGRGTVGGSPGQQRNSEDRNIGIDGEARLDPGGNRTMQAKSESSGRLQNPAHACVYAQSHMLLLDGRPSKRSGGLARYRGAIQESLAQGGPQSDAYKLFSLYANFLRQKGRYDEAQEIDSFVKEIPAGNVSKN